MKILTNNKFKCSNCNTELEIEKSEEIVDYLFDLETLKPVEITDFRRSKVADRNVVYLPAVKCPICKKIIPIATKGKED